MAAARLSETPPTRAGERSMRRSYQPEGGSAAETRRTPSPLRGGHHSGGGGGDLVKASLVRPSRRVGLDRWRERSDIRTIDLCSAFQRQLVSRRRCAMFGRHSLELEDIVLWSEAVQSADAIDQPGTAYVHGAVAAWKLAPRSWSGRPRGMKAVHLLSRAADSRSSNLPSTPGLSLLRERTRC